MILTDFLSLPPRFTLGQEATLRWLVQAHSLSESRPTEAGNPGDREEAHRRVAALFRRHACGPDRINTRSVEIPDFSHTDWEKMELFSPGRDGGGPSTEARAAFFQQAGKRVCQEILPGRMVPPDHLIHVTCTGYRSPSCAQEAVAANGWHDRTTVTHAYHMGCYAALPALRIAAGFLRGGRGESGTAHYPGDRVDILHTEICSLHFQTGNPTPEQVVVQSLFADGFIRYSASPAPRRGLPDRPALRLEAALEEMIPDSLAAMSWSCTSTGMRMGLSREVPALIEAALGPFVGRLCDRGGWSFQAIREKAVYAIHPGGPRIIDGIQALFRLADEQVGVSREILRRRGNMSSATLPHIWEAILAGPKPGEAASRSPAAGSPRGEGTPVVCLAFGPGLCMSGALLRIVA